MSTARFSIRSSFLHAHTSDDAKPDARVLFRHAIPLSHQRLAPPTAQRSCVAGVLVVECAKKDTKRSLLHILALE